MSLLVLWYSPFHKKIIIKQKLASQYFQGSLDLQFSSLFSPCEQFKLDNPKTAALVAVHLQVLDTVKANTIQSNTIQHSLWTYKCPLDRSNVH